jgi:hypothetical protein
MVGTEHSAVVESSASSSSSGAGKRTRIVPRGITHAIDVRTGEVACGRPAGGLIEFPDLDWERSAFLVACQACRQVVLE